MSVVPLPAKQSTTNPFGGDLYGGWWPSDGGEDGFAVKLRYRFRAPNGTWLVGEDSCARSDLENAPLPAPGATVAVLFVDSTAYEVL